MRSLALMTLILAAAMVTALPGRAAEDGPPEQGIGYGTAADEVAPAAAPGDGAGPELAPAAMVVPVATPRSDPPPLDGRTRDLLVMAALVCLLLAALLLNASALRGERGRRTGPPRRPAGSAATQPPRPAAPSDLPR